MSAVSLDDKTELKRHILRGVYEDNVGIRRTSAGRDRAPAPHPPPVASRQPARRPLLATLLVAVALAAAALGLHEGATPWLKGLGVAERPAPVSPQGPAGVAPGPEAAQTLADAPHGPGRPGAAPAVALYDIGRGPEQWNWQVDVPLDPPADYVAFLRDSKVPIADLFGLEVHTIVIDPGHGGTDPGATGAGGLEEKEVTLDIARRLRERLGAYGNIRVLLTREDDSRISLKERVAFAKARGADLFVSIHVNALPVDRIAMIETYYFGPHQDEQTLKLAERENDGSEFAVGEFKEIIAKIGDTMKTQESKVLATSIQRNLFRNLKRRNQDLVSWGIKTAPFVVLLGVDVPSVLAEVSCITNPDEEQRLATEGYRDEIAGYLEKGIVGYLRKSAHDKEESTEGALKYAAREEIE
ncbi:MAG: N-acetylmuramoyl-L-alanine amidase [Chromatiales bacterium]|jgi:N-acetylmuramoyl-L-alanine amidase